ncbi:MAG: type II secretion system protein GspG [Deltaproteobacteria bacterium]|nr:MAG: type II secretion system protein GspG [Deltaproteobacteria bacterium]
MKNYRNSFKLLKAKEGFTLVELLVVITVLGILAALVLPRVTGQTAKAKVSAAKIQIRALEDALNQFEVENGFFPSTEQGLEALVSQPNTGKEAKNWREGGYLQRPNVPKDPWENKYIYLSPGNNGAFDLSSYGADGLPGGEGNDADINNWELE